MKLFREYASMALGVGGGVLAVAAVACALIVMAGGGDTSTYILLGGIGAVLSIFGILMMP